MKNWVKSVDEFTISLIFIWLLQIFWYICGKYGHMNDNKEIIFNENYFDVIDSNNKAYLLGFFLADGSLTEEHKNNPNRNSSFRLGLLNSIDDIIVIEEFRNNICPNKKIDLVFNNAGAKNRKPQCRIRWTSSHMFFTLINNYNIKPRKTYDDKFKFPFDKIADEYLSHFIRGFFDGDGSITFHKYKNSFQFNFGFTINSKIFANQIADIFETRFIGVKRTLREFVGKNCTYYQLRFNFGRNRTELMYSIYNWLYKDSCIFLERKKSKFIKYFEYRGKL